MTRGSQAVRLSLQAIVQEKTVQPVDRFGRRSQAFSPVKFVGQRNTGAARRYLMGLRGLLRQQPRLRLGDGSFWPVFN